jgi:hypothetical protein
MSSTSAVLRQSTDRWPPWRVPTQAPAIWPKGTLVFSPRRQFADVIPFDQPEIRVIIEYDLCFAGLENRIYSSASSSESILDPRISRDELAVGVVKTQSNSVHLNPLLLIYSDQGRNLSPSACLPWSRTPSRVGHGPLNLPRQSSFGHLAESDLRHREGQRRPSLAANGRSLLFSQTPHR